MIKRVPLFKHRGKTIPPTLTLDENEESYSGETISPTFKPSREAYHERIYNENSSPRTFDGRFTYDSGKKGKIFNILTGELIGGEEEKPNSVKEIEISGEEKRRLKEQSKKEKKQRLYSKAGIEGDYVNDPNLRGSMTRKFNRMKINETADWFGVDPERVTPEMTEEYLKELREYQGLNDK